jgi:hypothetical protein
MVGVRGGVRFPVEFGFRPWDGEVSIQYQRSFVRLPDGRYDRPSGITTAVAVCLPCPEQSDLFRLALFRVVLFSPQTGGHPAWAFRLLESGEMESSSTQGDPGSTGRIRRTLTDHELTRRGVPPPRAMTSCRKAHPVLLL